MKGPSGKTLGANVAAWGLLAWLYGGDLADALRARSAEVAAFSHLPSLWRPAAVLALAAGAVGVAVWGLLRRRGDDFKGYRLSPLILVGALFLDLVVAEPRVPVGSWDMASLALQHFHGLVQERTPSGEVPVDPRVLGALVKELGVPPYLVHGEPVREYTLQVRENCEGPVRSAAGLLPGTLLYCVAPQRQGAWVSLVGLPAERRFGPAEVLAQAGETRFLLVQPVKQDEADTPARTDAFREGAEPGVGKQAPKQAP
ncbi:hypothetical protein POL68_14560 [Stigmatella sp. ncwal1]|uniref:Uncharacterized protein n=1 Tax=Stigmatella ashevillensis TaxID=2995309 RepID=A0ABT5D7Q2_9BACT|nr:hypothetical protein [Stigmatella ashevillena]MDC0709691.1 hypothetical protein [Stigmatella ashevillena]